MDKYTDGCEDVWMDRQMDRRNGQATEDISKGQITG